MTDNAFKFTKEGSVQLLVSVERDADTDQDYLRYLVSSEFFCNRFRLLLSNR